MRLLRLLGPRVLITPVVIGLCAAAVHSQTPAAQPAPAANNPGGSALASLRAEPSADATLLPTAVHSAEPYFAQPPAKPPAMAPAARDVVELSRLRYEEVDNEGLSTQVVQRLFRINTDVGAQFFGVDDIWYDGSRSEFHLWRAEVTRNSKVIGGGSDAGDAIPHATGNRARRVQFPRLEAGDTIELVYLLTPTHRRTWSELGGKYLGDLFAFRGPYFVNHVEYVLRSYRPLAVSEMGLNKPEFNQLNGAYIWKWTAENLPPFFADPNGPSITDASPFVQISDFPHWEDLANWYGAFLDSRSTMSPQFRSKLLSLVPRSKDQRQIVSEVWGYLSTHLRYLGHEEGLHAYLPSKVENVFAAQAGDCKDGALLLVAWLRAEGLDANLALVRTRHMGQVAPGAATLAAFDHAVVFIGSTDQWIDTTAPNFRASELPASDQGGLALIIRPHENELVRIPQASPRANYTERTVRLMPQHDGSYLAEGHIHVRGADAPSLRMRYATPADRKDVFQQWLDRNFPGAQLQKLMVFGTELGQNEVEVDFRARLPRGSRSANLAWTPRHYTPILASELTRSEPKSLDLRWTTAETWSMPVRSSQCASLQHQAHLDRVSPFGEVHVAARCSSNWLTVKTLVSQTAEEVAEKDYSEFRKFWVQTDHELNLPVFSFAATVQPDRGNLARVAALAAPANTPSSNR